MESLHLTTGVLLSGRPELDPLSPNLLLDFLVLFVCGVRESVELVSELGTLTGFQGTLEKLGFSRTAPGFGLVHR